jgi:hypothetical protein
VTDRYCPKEQTRMTIIALAAFPIAIGAFLPPTRDAGTIR